jgi:hypothetical protein
MFATASCQRLRSIPPTVNEEPRHRSRWILRSGEHPSFANRRVVVSARPERLSHGSRQRRFMLEPVEQEDAYREKLEEARTTQYLLQMFTTEGAHCGFTTAEWVGVLRALLMWIDTNSKPSQQDVVPIRGRRPVRYCSRCRKRGPSTHYPSAVHARKRTHNRRQSTATVREQGKRFVARPPFSWAPPFLVRSYWRTDRRGRVAALHHSRHNVAVYSGPFEMPPAPNRGWTAGCLRHVPRYADTWRNSSRTRSQSGSPPAASNLSSARSK